MELDTARGVSMQSGRVRLERWTFERAKGVVCNFVNTRFLDAKIVKRSACDSQVPNRMSPRSIPLLSTFCICNFPTNRKSSDPSVVAVATDCVLNGYHASLVNHAAGLIWRWWDMLKTVEGASALYVLPGYKCKYESSVLSKLSKSTVWHRKV